MLDKKQIEIKKRHAFTQFHYFMFFKFCLGPINQEMRNLIQSLQKHNQQLKSESQRYRRKAKEAQAELNKVSNL